MKKNVKVFLSIMLVLLSSFISPLSANAESHPLRIGILQHVEHVSYDENRLGMIEGLHNRGYIDGENIIIDYQNASGNQSVLQSLAEKLVNENDYILAVGTPALQALANVTTELPIYFSSVTDPVGTGAVSNLEKPGANITGTSNLGPIKEQIDLMLSIQPEAYTIGLIYNSGESNSQYQVDRAVDYLTELGLEAHIQTITSSNEIQQVLGKQVKEIDALFLVTDNTTATAMPLVGELAKSENMGVYGATINMIEENGLATYGLNYYDLGVQTIEMLLETIENNIAPGDQAIQYAKNLELFVNEEYANTIQIDPASIQAPDSDNTQLTHE